MFGSWWTVVIFAAGAVGLHGLAYAVKSQVVVYVTLFYHVLAVTALLLLESTLRQLFVFMLVSVTAGFIFSWIFAEQKKRKAEELKKAQAEIKEETPSVKAETSGASNADALPDNNAVDTSAQNDISVEEKRATEDEKEGEAK